MQTEISISSAKRSQKQCNSEEFLLLIASGSVSLQLLSENQIIEFTDFNLDGVDVETNIVQDV
jgi:hypothetical protein